MKGFFVTGTGTGVGKSVVSVSIIGALRSMGLDVCGMKPVESGCEDGAADGELLRLASGAEEPMELITPYAFRAPLAPLSAARLESRVVDRGAILRSARQLASRHEVLVVEGVGGFLVPLGEDGYLVRDMARDLGMPVIVAATPFLGTVNHTLLTVEAVRGAGLDLAGVVFSRNSGNDDRLTSDSSRSLVEELTGMPLLGELPYMEGAPSLSVSGAGSTCIRMDMLREFI